MRCALIFDKRKIAAKLPSFANQNVAKANHVTNGIARFQSFASSYIQPYLQLRLAAKLFDIL